MGILLLETIELLGVPSDGGTSLEVLFELLSDGILHRNGYFLIVA